jgi:uncharacterized protein
MNHQLSLKLERLAGYLRTFDRVGVACSGGVDSTFLAYACCSALGIRNVHVLFADSVLLSTALRDSIETFLRTELGEDLWFSRINVNPFSLEGFDQNPTNRCYVCKKHIYEHFLEQLQNDGVSVLMDGTNCDDLQEDRPGLQAIEELKIVTPLVEAGFCKSDVRTAASHYGLANAALPSNSCLATRIALHDEISDQQLRTVEVLEAFLHDRGFHGCRVKPRQDSVIIEVRSEDLGRICAPGERGPIVSHFQGNGYDRVLLSLIGKNG